MEDDQNGRSRSNSKERVGEKSPRDTTGRIKTGISEEELEEILRELQKTGGNKVKRVRKQLFEEEDEEEETQGMMRRIIMTQTKQFENENKEEDSEEEEEDISTFEWMEEMSTIQMTKE